MEKKDINHLREALFDQIRRLGNAITMEDINMEAARSASLTQLTDSIISTARVENEFISLTNGKGSGFIPSLDVPINIGSNDDTKNNDPNARASILPPRRADQNRFITK